MPVIVRRLDEEDFSLYKSPMIILDKKRFQGFPAGGWLPPNTIIKIAACYRPNVCVSSKFTCRVLTPNIMVLGNKVFGQEVFFEWSPQEWA